MMDLEKIEVKNWQVQNIMVHVQQLIGLCGYYRKFIENFAGIAEPLHSLLRKGRKWIWTEKCQGAFGKLKYRIYLCSTKF